ncbi:hypothetical protein MCOR25_002629 [Pyricularia grisea]|uniref:Cytochrome P450 n=1 Tax=Pyricularia grisea TaxID=148305 RepID=A0A6P8BFA4_PYRGI|nr:uncharacterized protein PgNI_00454 [Pyricularia grisea]KAI6377132.1 hypothetical protein MCOR25_002629 [Pyricularia grisea]TLD15468.1 hypothetical protein PgNI_00454 [Pyricularia grisea]
MILLIISLILLLSWAPISLRRIAAAARAAYDARGVWLKDRLAGGRIHRTVSVVNFSYTGYRSSLDRRLALRALPNQRLANAFGIHNSFATFDRKVHMNFLKRSYEAVSKADHHDWLQLFDHACRVVEGYSDVLGKSSDGILLASMVRKVCLRVVMRHLFDSSVEGTSLDHEYQTATDQINLQWIASKQNHAANQVERSYELEQALRSIMKQSPLPPDEAEPVKVLEFLLPAYETLFRLLTRYTRIYRDWLTTSQEGLRLYPSTKRVYRAVNVSSDTDQSRCGHTIGGDIEAVHLDPNSWGPDVRQFRPKRFINLTSLQKVAYLPFGTKPHRCPAYAGFGERLIALLVAALCTRFHPSMASVQLRDASLDGKPKRVFAD